MAGFRLPTLVGCFALLNLFDLASTWLLVGCWEIAYEANPIGGLVLRHFGWIGLCVFKITCTALPILLAWLIFLHDPRSARFVIRFGIGLLCGIVIYHCFLMIGNLDAIERVAAAQERVRVAEKYARKFRAFTKRADALAKEMYYSDFSLTEAVEQLEAMGHNADVAIHIFECSFGPIGKKACLAADLIRRTIRRVDRNSIWGKRRLSELTTEFHRFHHSLPMLISIMINRLEANPGETRTNSNHY